MLRACVGVALGCVLLAGCGGGAAGKKAPSAGMSSVTLHVDQMTKRLNLF